MYDNRYVDRGHSAALLPPSDFLELPLVVYNGYPGTFLEFVIGHENFKVKESHGAEDESR